MKVFFMMILSLQIIKVFARKYSSSEESIENLLYYKETKQKPKQQMVLQRLRGGMPVTEQPQCFFPKMCCSMSCDNRCGDPQQSYSNRKMEPDLPDFESIHSRSLKGSRHVSVQPQIINTSIKKNLNPQQNQILLNGVRRDGFTKERIKSLISQDEDIRKILKDLVRVTMQKVDLLGIIHKRNSEATANSGEYE